MSYLGWILIGGLAGLGASRISNPGGGFYLIDALVGVGGALLGGVVCMAFAEQPSQVLHLPSLLTASLVATVALRSFHWRFPRKVALKPKASMRWH